MNDFDPDRYLEESRRRVDRELDAILPSEETRPAALHRAMRYAALGPGKRIRPILSLAAARAVDPAAESASLRPGCAVELVHAYSLVHDDLPSMDDDDFRRGRPTTHRVFGEALAVLTGDALLTLAFRVLADCPGNRRYRPADFVQTLATAAGSRGLVAGQVEDLAAEGSSLTIDAVRFIHENKTARLITCAVVLGGMAAAVESDGMERLTTYGRSLGLAFQIIDDLLDITGDLESLGKEAGADAAHGKATWPAVVGIEQARRDARELHEKALEALEPWGPEADPLRAIARRMIARTR